MATSRLFLCVAATIALVGASAPQDRSLVYKIIARNAGHAEFFYGGAESCPKTGNADGELRVGGPRGANATLKIWCGDGATLGSCTATSPGPPNSNKCTIVKVGLDNSGQFHCEVTRATRNATYIASCDDP